MRRNEPLTMRQVEVLQRNPALVRRNEPLTMRQVEVLQWIGEGCPDGVWRDFTYKTTAYALGARGLVTVDRRRKQWSAALTSGGQFYLTHGHHPLDDSPIRGALVSETSSETDFLAEQLLAELASGDGEVLVPFPSETQRARHRRAIHRWSQDTASPRASSFATRAVITAI